jgi:glyoxalase family protein
MPDHISIRGLHHVTAIASGAQANLDFYTRVLGLRLVKRTVNFDAPDTYHFYYGDVAGSPGSLLTFFPFADAAAGRAGTGMAETTAFAVPESAFEPWMSRLADEGREFDGPVTRFGAQVLGLRDPDGLQIELVTEPGLDGSAPGAGGSVGPVGAEHAIRRLHSVALCVEAPERTARLLTETFGYEAAGDESGRQRFRVQAVGPAGIVDLLCQPDRMRGRMGAGTVHHVAFRAQDEAEQLHLARGCPQPRVRRHAGAGPTIFSFHLLPRARRCAVRDCHQSAGVRHRRGARGAWNRAEVAILAGATTGRNRTASAAPASEWPGGSMRPGGAADPHHDVPVAEAGAPLRRAKALVVMLHGRGADAGDMLSLAEVFAQPDLAYLAPQAAGRSWYPYSFLAPIARNEPFLSSALEMLDRVLGRLGAESYQPGRVVLLGET